MDRIDRLREMLREQNIDALILTPGSTLHYVTGDSFIAYERLFLLIVPAQGTPAVVLPAFDCVIWRAQVDFDARAACNVPRPASISCPC